MNILKLIKSLHPKATNAKLEQMVFGRSTNSWNRDIRLLEKELVKRNEQLNRIGLEVIVRKKMPIILCDQCLTTPVENEGEWCQACQIF